MKAATGTAQDAQGGSCGAESHWPAGRMRRTHAPEDSALDIDSRRSSSSSRGSGSREVGGSRPGVAAPSSDSAGRESVASPSAARSPRLSRTIEADELLVDRIRSGDRTAFDELYQRYFKRIYAFLDKRLRNRADTEETTQEVFINVFSSIDTFRGEAPFAAWIFGLTRRTLAARFRRKRHPTVPLFEEDEEHPVGNLTASASPEATPLEHYEMAERARQLRSTLEHEITDEQRQLFELHHIESVPIAEIARTFSKSEDAVKSNLYRTRKLLLAR